MVNRAIVSPPERPPLIGGLFSALTFRNEGRWLEGVTYPGHTCGPASYTYADPCAEDSEINREAEDEDDSAAVWEESLRPIQITGTFRCSPVGITPSEAEARAIEDLMLHEETTVEEWLWKRGFDAAGSAPFPEVSEAVTLKDAVARFEHHAAREYGAAGLIHAPRDVASRMLADGLAEVKGQQIRTKMGTTVIAGGGYDGDSLVLSPQMVAYRTDAEVPVPFEQALNRQNNLLDIIAQRTYLLGFDSCGIVSLDITL